MPIGEDVDLVWRMTTAGQRIVYDPAATVRHDHRTRPAAFIRRRWSYARSIGPLARRHPGALVALRVDLLAAGMLAALVARRPVIASAAVAMRFFLIRRAIRPAAGAHATQVAARITARTTAGTLRAAGHATRRAWSPLLVASRHREAKAMLCAAYAIRFLERAGPHRPGDVVVAVVDDAVAALGAWAACLEFNTAEPLWIAWSSRHHGEPAAGA